LPPDNIRRETQIVSNLVNEQRNVVLEGLQNGNIPLANELSQISDNRQLTELFSEPIAGTATFPQGLGLPNPLEMINAIRNVANPQAIGRFLNAIGNVANPQAIGRFLNAVKDSPKALSYFINSPNFVRFLGAGSELAGKANLWVAAGVALVDITKLGIAGVDWAKASGNASEARGAMSTVASNILAQVSRSNSSQQQKIGIYESIANDSSLSGPVKQLAIILRRYPELEYTNTANNSPNPNFGNGTLIIRAGRIPGLGPNEAGGFSLNDPRIQALINAPMIIRTNGADNLIRYIFNSDTSDGQFLERVKEWEQSGSINGGGVERLKKMLVSSDLGHRAGAEAEVRAFARIIAEGGQIDVSGEGIAGADIPGEEVKAKYGAFSSDKNAENWFKDRVGAANEQLKSDQESGRVTLDLGRENHILGKLITRDMARAMVREALKKSSRGTNVTEVVVVDANNKIIYRGLGK
jgi:hypothetical protein